MEISRIFTQASHKPRARKNYCIQAHGARCRQNKPHVALCISYISVGHLWGEKSQDTKKLVHSTQETWPSTHCSANKTDKTGAAQLRARNPLKRKDPRKCAEAGMNRYAWFLSKGMQIIWLDSKHVFIFPKGRKQLLYYRFCEQYV